MTDEERQRMNVRVIRVTLASALRHAAPAQARRCRVRALELLARQRSEPTASAVIAEIEALQTELDGDVLGQQVGES